MCDGILLTRRALCLGAIAAPGVASAAPLLDPASGRGLFSQFAARRDNGGGSGGGWRNLFGGGNADLAPGAPPMPRFRLSRPVSFALRNANTDEEMTLALRPGSQLTYGQTAQLDRFLRDWRQNEVKPIDGAVLGSLLAICASFSGDAGSVDVRITSGYRSKATNDMLRRKSRNVARNSMHLQARAIDFSVPGISSATLARAARKLCPGGVGRYRTFVHIDSGPKRSWSA